jgi:hypothetical protein
MRHCGPCVAHGVQRRSKSDVARRPAIFELRMFATLLACGAGDGNRTRTVSLGMVTVPA